MNDLLLQEEEELNSFEILTEGENKRPFLRGVLGRADYPNKNKRVYPKHVMKEAVENLKPLVESRGFFGELGHPEGRPKIQEDKISHYISKLELAEDGALIGEIMPTRSYYGKMLEAYLQDGLKMGVSTRATGALKPYKGPLGEGLLEVQPGLRMFAIDIVSQPSAGTYPDIVTEDVNTVVFGSTKKFREIWDSCFS